MATFSYALCHVKARLRELLPAGEILSLCKQSGHVWRKRILDPVLTVELFVLQLLAGVAMAGLRHVAGIAVTAQAICKAKKRLPLKLLMELVGRSAPDPTTPPLWNGLSVYMADGMSFMTPDTAELAAHYGKGRNQRGASFGYPLPKLLALLDWSGGFIHKVITLPSTRQEFTCLSRLFGAVGEGGLLLGDRGLVSFAHLAMLTGAAIQGCFRLPRGQVCFGRGRGSRRLIKRLGKQDVLVRWTAYRRPSWLSRKRWAALARQELVLRQISYRVCRKGFRTQWAWIITTLTDPRRYPAQELVDLYGKRWQIEVYFRDLKRTLSLAMMSARSLLGVRKEVLTLVLLYNLIRRVMRQAARGQGVDSERISFIDALRWLLWSGPGQPLCPLKINRRRIRRSPPRQLKAARHRFSQLRGSRDELSKPPCQTIL